MANPRIPHFEEGIVDLETFEDLEAYLRSTQLIAGPGIEISRNASYTLISAPMPARMCKTTEGPIPAATLDGDDLVPGSETVTLCAWADDRWTPTDNTITAYNECTDTEVAADTFCKLKWVDGKPVVILPCGSEGGASGSRCDCPEDTSFYAVRACCVPCCDERGPSMPKWFKVVIVTSTTNPSAVDPCADVTCDDLDGKVIWIKNQTDEYGDPTCTWLGSDGFCWSAELSFGATITLTITDENDCVVAILTMADSAWACCATNDAWTQPDDEETCLITARVEYDPCYCCPDLPVCPPDGKPACVALVEDCGCEYASRCEIVVTVTDLSTPPPPAEGDACGGMNGVYTCQWISDCTWFVEGGTGGAAAADTLCWLTYVDGEWEVELLGPDGQSAYFTTTDWACGVSATADLDLVTSSCQVGGQAQIEVIP